MCGVLMDSDDVRLEATYLLNQQGVVADMQDAELGAIAECGLNGRSLVKCKS